MATPQFYMKARSFSNVNPYPSWKRDADYWEKDVSNNLYYMAGNIGIGYSVPQGGLVITGNVGIGTNNPLGKLDVRGDIIGSGNVGIGTNNPQRLFHVQGNNGVWRLDRDSNTVGLQFHRFPAGDFTIPWKGFLVGVEASGVNNGNFLIADYGTSVGGAATTRLLINNDGNVGIGTNNPFGKLDVRGDGLITGNVGIGTNNPQQGFHIQGKNILIDGSKVYSNLFEIFTNNVIRITIPYTKQTYECQTILEVLATANAANGSGQNFINFKGMASYYASNVDFSTIEKKTNSNTIKIKPYVVVSSQSSGNIIVDIDGDDGYLENVNWCIHINLYGVPGIISFKDGTITSVVATITNAPYANMNQEFAGNAYVSGFFQSNGCITLSTSKTKTISAVEVISAIRVTVPNGYVYCSVFVHGFGRNEDGGGSASSYVAIFVIWRNLNGTATVVRNDIKTNAYYDVTTSISGATNDTQYVFFRHWLGGATGMIANSTQSFYTWHFNVGNFLNQSLLTLV